MVTPVSSLTTIYIQSKHFVLTAVNVADNMKALWHVEYIQSAVIYIAAICHYCKTGTGITVHNISIVVARAAAAAALHILNNYVSKIKILRPRHKA